MHDSLSTSQFFGGPSENRPSSVADDARQIRRLKAENKELGLRQEAVIQENQMLVDKERRMADNMKKMKYEEAMESKMNMTGNNMNR